MNIELAGKLLELNMILEKAVDSRNSEKDMSDYKKKIVDTIYPEDKKIITEKLKPFEKDIKKYLSLENGSLFMYCIYSYACSKNVNIENLEDFYDYALSLEEKEIWESIETKESKDELLEEIANNEMQTPEEKWYMVNFVLKPREVLGKIIELIKVAEEIYTPFYEKYRAEREEYRKNFFLKRLKKEISMLNDSFIDYLGDDYHFFVLSPILLSLYAFEIHGKKVLVLSPEMEKIYSNENFEKEDDKVYDLIKLLGDKSRYEVLQSISKEKTKDLAEKLGITSAAVSFHVKKLLTANVLKLGTIEDNDVKYEVNTKVIERIIGKLQKDFLEK